MSRVYDLKNFLDASPSVYHAVDQLSKMLAEGGYQRITEGQEWDLQPGGKYFLTRGGSSVLAFRMPMGEPTGFMMSASHSDHPAFKIKENAEMAGTYTRLAVEPYGGMPFSTWMDRPLSVAGRVMVETENGAEVKLIDLDQDLMIIPNVAPHLNRGMNDGMKFNPAVDTIPLIGGKGAKGKLGALIDEAAGGKILGKDLYLYIRQKATVWGIDEQYISAPALDDLECAWGCTAGFLASQPSDAIAVLCVFDNEEIGSASVQGAGSTFLPDVLRRICRCCGRTLSQMLSQSFMISADNAQALHPNHPELYDPYNAPVMGGGVVLKYNANLAYCTDGISSAVFRLAAKKAGITLQTYSNRADLRGGSTLGHVSLMHVSVPTADIGLPQLAMHSSYETAAASDADDLVAVMAAYYSSSLTVTPTGFTMN